MHWTVYRKNGTFFLGAIHWVYCVCMIATEWNFRLYCSFHVFNTMFIMGYMYYMCIFRENFFWIDGSEYWFSARCRSVCVYCISVCVWIWYNVNVSIFSEYARMNLILYLCLSLLFSALPSPPSLSRFLILCHLSVYGCENLYSIWLNLYWNL